MLGPIAKFVVNSSCARPIIHVVRPRVRTARTGDESAFVNIQDSIVVVIDVLKIIDIVAIVVRQFTVIVIDVQRLGIGSICCNILVRVRQDNVAFSINVFVGDVETIVDHVTFNGIQ